MYDNALVDDSERMLHLSIPLSLPRYPMLFDLAETMSSKY